MRLEVLCAQNLIKIPEIQLKLNKTICFSNVFVNILMKLITNKRTSIKGCFMLYFSTQSLNQQALTGHGSD